MISKRLKTAGLLVLILVFAVSMAACDMDSDTSDTIDMNELNVNISGEGEVEPDGGKFDKDANIEVTAVPAEGWEFSHWEGNVAEEEEKSTVLMKGETELTAVFNWEYSHLLEDGEVMSPSNERKGRNILVVVNGRAQGSGIAYSSIQEAVDDAKEGDKILVTPGTYEGDVDIDVEGLTLKSVNGPDVTTIDAEGNPVAIQVKSDLGDVTVDGFTVENWTAIGIGQSMSERDGTALHVLDNVVNAPDEYSAHGNAIQVSGDKSSVIGNEVTVSAEISEEWAVTGILVIGADDISVKNNFVEGYLGEGSYGIAVAGDRFTGNKANNNSILDNQVSNSYIGIIAQGNKEEDGDKYDAVYTEVDGNTLKDNNYHVVDSTFSEDLDLDEILVANTFPDEKAKVVGNTIRDIEENNVYNLDSGFVDESTQAVIDDEDTEAGHTILVGQGTYDEFTIDKGLTVQAVEGDEVIVESGSENIPGNLDKGIYIATSEDVTIERVNIVGPGTRGIVVATGYSPILTVNDTTISDFITGIYLNGENGDPEDSASASVTFNAVDNTIYDVDVGFGTDFADLTSGVTNNDIDASFEGIGLNKPVHSDDTIMKEVEAGDLAEDLSEDNFDIEVNVYGY